MADYLPKPDSQFQDWLGNFINVANANLIVLGLVTADYTALNTEKTAFDSAITDSEAKNAAAKSATKKKQSARKKTETLTRQIVKRIQAKPDVSSDLKAALQINVPGSTPPPPEIPNAPTDLVANIIGSGSYELTWKRNNTVNILIFIVEARYGATGDYIFVGNTTKTTFTSANNAPGQTIYFRVKAQRNEKFSDYSNTAIVNDGVAPV